MAYTKISDVIVPEVFDSYMDQERNEVSRVVQNSVAVVESPVLSAYLAGGGLTFNAPSWTPTDGGTENVSSDETTNGTETKVVAESEIAIRQQRNVIYAGADLAGALAGSDPVAAAARQAAADQMLNRQALLLKMLEGLFDEGTGVMQATHANDVFIEDGNNAAAANLISADNVIGTLAPWGDKQGSGHVLMVHSTPWRKLQSLNLIDFQPTNVQDLGWGTYLGMTLVVDDTITSRAGSTSGTVYNSYIMKPGAILVGSAAPKVPSAVEREETQGHGGGIEKLIVRDQYTYHVRGTKFTGTPAGDLPTNAEMATPASYSKVYGDKNIGVVVLRTNG